MPLPDPHPHRSQRTPPPTGTLRSGSSFPPLPQNTSSISGGGLAGAGVGKTLSSPRCSRILMITSRSVIAEIHLRLEPHTGHFKTSTANTLFKSSDQEYLEHGREALAAAPEPLLSLTRRGTISLRQDAPGASTPW